MKKIIYLLSLLFILSFFIPHFISLSDFVSFKLTHKKNPDHPLYEELYQIRYQDIWCNPHRELSSVVQKYIPIGTSKAEVLNIMERNGFNKNSGQSYGFNSNSGPYGQPYPNGRLIWRTSRPRQSEIQFDFNNNKVVSINIEQWCF